MANEIPILTAFKGHSPMEKNLIVDTIIKRSSVLNILPMIQITKGFTMSELENVTGQTGNPAFRALNADYTDSYSEFRERTYGVKQLGDSMKIEKKVEKQLPGTLLKQTRLKLLGLGMFVDDKFINGDSSSDPKEFDGLKTILGTDSATCVGTGSDITVNSSAANFLSFLERLDEAYRLIAGNADAIWMSDLFYDKVTAGARLVGAHALGTTKDFLGNEVLSYKGVPFLKMGNNQAGSAILPSTEAVGGGSSQTSVYVTKLNIDDGVAGLSTGGIQILPDEDNLFHRDVIDFDLGLKVPTASAIRVCRLKSQ